MREGGGGMLVCGALYLRCLLKVGHTGQGKHVWVKLCGIHRIYSKSLAACQKLCPASWSSPCQTKRHEHP